MVNSTLHRPIWKQYARALLIFSCLLLAACSGSGSGGSGERTINNNTNDNQTETGIAEDFQGDEAPTFKGPNFSINLGRTVQQTASEEFVSWFHAFFGEVIDPLNDVPMALTATVPIAYRECGLENAFYDPQNNMISLCDELANRIYNDLLDDDIEQSVAFAITFNTIAFVLYHEVGHALVHLLELPVAGNTESAADAIATVLSVESGNSIFGIRGGLFSLNQPETFADVHGGGQDRAGDVLCWTIGGDSAFLFNPALSEIVTRFIENGRDCTAEYQGQRATVLRWLPGFGQVERKTILISHRVKRTG